MSKEAFRWSADTAFSALPGKEVKVGEQWQRTSKLEMGPLGSYDTTYHYTYKGKDNNLDKIEIQTDLKYSPPRDGGEALPFKIKSAKLEARDGKGEISFNAEKGRVEKSEMSMALLGYVEIEINGQTTKVELSQTQTATVCDMQEGDFKVENPSRILTLFRQLQIGMTPKQVEELLGQPVEKRSEQPWGLEVWYIDRPEHKLELQESPWGPAGIKVTYRNGVLAEKRYNFQWIKK